ncbi:hypothetical protein GCM10009867_05130 [Pedococcus aerophilus]|uniref:Thioredoxin domain-containing protein n=1 Tax=Pedococcus aerophilus TaxID=436356 RepID=A0ABP6GWJ4_9MICO|nr:MULTISPECIES: thioredoxin domain-containing protein [unclassified Phycicoccus]
MVTDDQRSCEALPGQPHRARNMVAMTRRRAVATALLLLLTLVAVGGCSVPTPTTGGGGSTGAVSPFAHVGAIPDTVSGAAFDAATLTGRPVVLWFWAPWCTICRSEAPAVTKVAAEFAGQVDIIGVAGQGGARAPWSTSSSRPARPL